MAQATASNEELVFATDEHWIKYVFPVFLYVLLSGSAVLIFVLAGITAHHMMWLSHAALLTGLLLLLVTHHWFFHTILSESTDRIMVTNRRIIHLRESLFFTDILREIPFDKIRAVEARKTNLVQTLLRYGTIYLDPVGDIRRIPHPHRTAAAIEQALGMR